MLNKLILCFAVLTVLGCKKDDAIEKEIAEIDINLTIERFDRAFAEARPEDLPKLKKTFPFLFPKRISDSVWISNLNDTLQQQLLTEVDKAFGDLKAVSRDLEQLFQHLKYYDKTFNVPRVITLTNFVDYRNKTITTDTIVLIALDNYLGTEHEFYGDIPKYLTQNMKSSQIVSDLAENYGNKYSFQSQRKTLLDELIYFGKLLYFKDKIVPFISDAEKMGYTQEQLDWAISNESYIWRYFIEKELLYSTDSSLPSRFVAPAPFTKFYLELDSESPGRLGQYIGWQIVRSYMEHNDVSLMDMLQKDADEIFNQAKFKPRKD
ncbi:gliding motility-associated lipoprotein GldB [Flavobacteriaceae bacterium MAR_2010_105]|nr:gliding motility-associated lipoprotein GldB [Flavobacteriaceae bacterium MAR_2010_105]